MAKFRKISVTVSPDSLYIFQDYESMENPLSVLIENESGKAVSVELELTLPESIEARFQQGKNDFKGNFKWKMDISAKSPEVIYIFFKHPKDKIGHEKLKLKAIVNGFVFQKFIEMINVK